MPEKRDNEERVLKESAPAYRASLPDVGEIDLSLLEDSLAKTPWERMQANDDARKRLSDNLKKARRAVGLSQEALALAAGINRSYVGQIERGIGNPSLLVMVKLAGTLKMDVADLLKRERGERRR